MGQNSPQAASKWAFVAFLCCEAVFFIGGTVWKAHHALTDTILETSGATFRNGLLLASVFCLLALFKTRIRSGSAFALAVLVSILVFGDKVHYRAFHDFATARELQHASQLIDVWRSITPYVRAGDFLFVADWPIWIFLLAIGGRVQRPVHKPIRLALAGITALSVLGYGASIFPFLNRNLTSTLSNNRRFVIRELGLLNYHLFDTANTICNPSKRKEISPEDFQQVQQWFLSKPKSTNSIVPFGVAKGCNVIFIQVESLEAFLIGLRIEGQEITPTLNRLTTNSYYFNRFFPQTGLGTTSDAEFSALNSLLPSREGTIAKTYQNNTFRALPAILNDHGYRSLAMSVCKPHLWNMGKLHVRYGFQSRYYYDTFAEGPEDPLAIPDDRFFKKAHAILQQQRQPFFAHLMTITTHSPFTRFPREKRSLNLKEWNGSILGDYLQAARFVDSALGEFLSGLKESGLLDTSIVFIYGDHQALPDDEWEKAQPFVADKEGFQIDTTIRRRVPLFVLVPKLASQSPISYAAGQTDIAPTVCHLLGVKTSSLFVGENIFSTDEKVLPFRAQSFDRFLRPLPAPIGNARGTVWVSDQIVEGDLISPLLKAATR